VPVGRLKNIDANEIIFSISGVPGENYPPDFDSFLSDKPNPGSLNAQVYSLNKKKVLGMIYDYIFETESGTRAGVLIEEVSIGQKKRFFAPTGKAFRAEDRAIGVRKILINPIELQQME